MQLGVQGVAAKRRLRDPFRFEGAPSRSHAAITRSNASRPRSGSAGGEAIAGAGCARGSAHRGAHRPGATAGATPARPPRAAAPGRGAAPGAPVDEARARHLDLEGGVLAEERVGPRGEQHSAFGQAVEQPRGDPSRRLVVEVDEDVAAEDEVHPEGAGRRVVFLADEVEALEAHLVPDAIDEDAAPSDMAEVVLEELAAHAAHRPVRVRARARLLEGGGGEVGAQDDGAVVQPFLLEQDGEAVGLLARRAARAPDPGARRPLSRRRLRAGSTSRRTRSIWSGSRMKWVSPTVSSSTRSSRAIPSRADQDEVGGEVVRSRALHGARDAGLRLHPPVGREHHARPFRHQGEDLRVLASTSSGARISGRRASASSREAASAAERKVVRS